MLELNISVNNNQHAQGYGKYYARVEYKQTMSIHDMAVHMAEHNTPFSVGTIEGILRDFVACTREQCLNGNTVKIDDLAIFKCSISANGLQLREDYKVNCGLGVLPKTGPDGTGSPDFTKQTQPAVKTVRLLAQATGEFTKKELNDDSSFRWTKAAADAIDAIVNPVTVPEP
ncbi:MAG: hypothetical protein IJJ56_11275 [Prevotella sp.]|nr:hypothetical protein [Prevotella sp.]MBR0166383.1 hypothetical protein [Prevotella sp.]